ncbi:hypothetical protein FPQ18DRAFT_97087 [Pyronema domesticum]|uniref:Uncharacterized protein n=1 Tax=Pyronema omphalodes (strain CBS 100304) TaxID=1076935 RepID=U4KZ32_PYROM|nr:hypothetical protein FPQ18DRAFT_97087 [Pyronema domesticum]CCX06955.1 Similar to hypothetical protein CIMG_00297 [Coccidioides immitis RS]; acc. no. XP_001246526 [Pyronema omphalodes CBS 100304]
MSFGYHFQAPSSGIRSRRNPHRPNPTSLRSFQIVRSREELTDSPAVPTFVEKFEAGRSFDVEDDFAFIPDLCTEEERIMMDSGSDRSSTSSGSPQSSPLQHQVQPSAYPYASTYNMQQQNVLKYSPPVPARQRNAIPIVNPSTGMRVPSPPLSSPGRVGSHSLSRRAW